MTTHGARKFGRNPPEYTAWCNMIARCENPGCNSFMNYGARGITICSRWRNSFSAFYADMGDRPSRLHSLDRKDTNGPYAPDNCQWSTRETQNRNRRSVIRVSVDGLTMTLKEAARAKGIPYGTVYQRVKTGWPIERALR